MTLRSHLQVGLGAALAVIALRAFPFVCALCRESALRPRDKIAASAAYGACVYFALGHSDFDARLLLLAYACLGLGAIAIYAVPLRASPAWLFPACCIVLLLAPSLYFAGAAVVTVLGWETVLGTYSYLMEVDRPRRALATYLFFLFVNPTVVYPRRGRRISAAGLHTGGLARAGWGTVALFASATIGSFERAPAYPGSTVISIVMRGASLYAAHVGLASVQIGLFRQLGHEVPERYVAPHMASDPRDFWARWNTYVGSWVRLYIFGPAARVLSQQIRVRSPELRSLIFASAVVSSFLFIGAYHDVYDSLIRRDLSHGMTVWFGVNAAVLVVWELSRRGIGKKFHAVQMRAPKRAATLLLLGVLLSALP